MIFNLSKEKFKDFSGKILVYTLIAYVFLILGRSVWQNFQLKREIDLIKNKIKMSKI